MRAKMSLVTIVPIIGIILIISNTTTTTTSSAIKTTKEYYYTRTRTDSNHLRISETVKNKFVTDIKYESKINGTNYEYYMSSLSMNHDELVFEVIDKVFRHRLSPFYIHHYDNEEDKKQSSDGSLVSQEACARDLLYLLDKQPKLNDRNNVDPFSRTDISSSNIEDDSDQISPELDAFFDSYAKQEPGLLMGNTYWVGAYDQCVNRQIFELTKSTPQSSIEPPIRRPRKVSATGELRDDDPQVISFKGRYCVASLKAPIWDRMIEERKQQDRYYFKTDRQIESYARLFRLQLGICLPSTCDSYAYERHHDEIKLLATAQLDPRYANYDLTDLYCLPDESSRLRRWSGSAIGFIVFMTVWLTGIFLATVADVFDFVDTTTTVVADKKNDTRHARKRTSTLQKLVTWFSLRSNYRKLMLVKCDEEADDKDDKKKDENNARSDEDSHKVGKIDESSDTKTSTTAEHQQSASDGPAKTTSCHGDKDTGEKQAHTESLNINLRFLNAFKVMIMFWIVNGHIMLLMIQTAKNILYSDALLNGLMHFLIGATFGVDLFFTMTGFLASYLIFNSGHAKRLKLATWLYMFFHRYWRLAPMYLLTFWFSRSVVQLLGSGPLWDYGTSGITFRGLCNQESWFYPLTLTSNLHGLFEECMIQSWYISCDMQFWLASPLFIYLLAKKPLYGWAASIASILISCKARYDVIVTDESARHDELVKPRADIFMRVSHDLPALYTHPQYRIGTYIIGMLAGHYVYMVKSGRWKTSMLSRHAPSQLGTTLSSNQNDDKNIELQKSAKTMTRRSFKRQVIAYMGSALVLMMSFAPYLLSHFFPYSLIDYRRGLAGLAYAIQHLVMSFGFSLVIITMCFGQWPRLVKFLSHPNWTRLSKINYAILLLQCEAIYYQIFRYDQVPLAGTKELINILLNLLMTLYPLAFAVTLIFEFPLANIEKLLI